MIVSLDVDYQYNRANTACLVFSEWNSVMPSNSYTSITNNIPPYESGQFYKRELPCLLNVLEKVTERIDVIVVDGYVWLGEDRKGLGAYLYESLYQEVPVVGVAKRIFYGAKDVAVEVLRGESQNPLWVTAAGMSAHIAAEHISAMSGDYRIPTLLKSTDSLCRQWSIF
ncbi:endonuclease V [Algivirga pacifica]|uniref:Endonuclease V n=1 Tax=Algivirga pacifica TaxID=1162670 RepID=A0ABP9DQ19_9BACT